MPEERLYSGRASIVFLCVILVVTLLAAVFLLGGCANTCQHRTGDGICVDEVKNSAG